MKHKLLNTIYTLIIIIGCSISTLSANNKDIEGKPTYRDTTLNPTALLIKAQTNFNIAGATNNISLLKQAKAEALNVIALEPNNDAAYMLLGRIASIEGNLEKSNEYFSVAYNLDKKNFYYGSAYANSLLNIGKVKEAEELLNELIENFPKKEEGYLTLLDIYLNSTKLDEAFSLAEKMEQNLGPNRYSYLTKFNIYMVRSQIDKAIDLLKQAEEREPTPIYQIRIADAYARIAKDSLSEIYYDKALAQGEDYPAAIIGKMEICRTNNRLDEFFIYFKKYLSLEEPPDSKLQYIKHILNSPKFFQEYSKEMGQTLKEFSDLNPKDTAIALTAAQFNAQIAQKEVADSILLRCISFYPDNDTINFNYLSFLYSFQEWERLLNFCQDLERKISHNSKIKYDIYELKSIADINLNRHDDAIETLLTVEKIAKKEHQNDRLLNIYGNLGDLYHIKNKLKECYKYYNKALKLDPEYPPVLNNYAWYLATESKKKDLDKAQQMSKIAITKESSNSIYLDTYAWILYLKGEYQEAKKYFQQAIAYGTDLEASILSRYAKCLYSLKEYDLSAEYYKKAIANALKSGNHTELEKIMAEIQDKKEHLKIDLIIKDNSLQQIEVK